MGELANRSRYSSTIDNDLKKKFDELAAETRINKSKLLDEAIEDLLKKYEKK